MYKIKGGLGFVAISVYEFVYSFYSMRKENWSRKENEKITNLAF